MEVELRLCPITTEAVVAVSIYHLSLHLDMLRKEESLGFQSSRPLWLLV